MIRLFRVFIPTSILGLLISETVFVLALYVGAIAWQIEDFLFYLRFEDGLYQVLFVTASVIGGLYLSDCYSAVRIRSRLAFAQQLCLVVGVAFLLQAVLSYARLNLRMPRQAMLLGSLACLLLLPLWRSFYGKISLQILGAEKLLFVGTHPLQFEVAAHLAENPEFAMKPLGFLVEKEASAGTIGNPFPVLGAISDLEQAARDHPTARIVVGMKGPHSAETIQEIISLQQRGRRVQGVGMTYEAVFGRVALSQLDPVSVLLQGGFAPSPVMMVLQSCYSWVIALIAALVTAPLMVLAAVAVRLSSPGPVLFRQVRAGRNNKPFVLYKFRSMYEDAERQTGAVWAQQNDPRVTPVGRWLRKYRLDELPQLINVLKGEMSLVGPRPERPEFVRMLAERIPFYMYRLNVKPGITGWAQINYRYGNTIEDSVTKLEYDLYYIRHLAPQLDFFIMFHTAKIMLLTRGAF